MPVERLKQQYPVLTSFLSEHFHQDAFYEHDDVRTMKELIDRVYESVFFNKSKEDNSYCERLQQEMDNFVHSLIYRRYKELYIEGIVETDLGGLEALEFISYLYYCLKIEQNEQTLLHREKEEK